MAEFRMPKLSDTMEEGTVLQWLRDEAAAAVDEVDDDAESTGGIPTADDGTGGAIGMALETYPGAEDEEPEPEPAAVTRAAPEPAPARAGGDDGDRVKASPLARRLA